MKKDLDYGRPKFEGDSAFDAWEYIKRWDIPICQAGASWQELENWHRQMAACKDVIRVLGLLNPHSARNMPPLLVTQCGGAVVMAENELKLFDVKVQKVIARLTAL